MNTRKQLDEYIELRKSNILKEYSPLLDSLDAKKRKLLKKKLQAAEPTEYFGQDFTELGELVDTLRELDLIKSDKKMSKKVKTMSESNVEIVATAAKLRKEYEILYEQLRSLVYPRKEGDLRDE
jgi:ABC-type phosphate transport system auxiliary subunit